MKRSQLVIAALTFSSVGAFAAANDTSSNASTSSSQSYTASVPGDNAQVSQIQQALNEQGFNVGTVDGQMGPRTKAALKQFQQQKGLQASGKLDQQTLAALTVNGNGASTSASTSSQQSSPSTSTPSSTPSDTSGASSPNSGTGGFSPQSPSGTSGNSEPKPQG